MARCNVERLMRSLGLRGPRRGRPTITTCPDRQSERAPDLVDREFSATAPNRLWVIDLTYVATWTGTVFTAFVSDVYSWRIVGWRCAARFAEAGAVATIGSIGDTRDNAPVESVIGLYKAECVRRDGPIRTVEDLELVTSSWVHWFNTRRLHSMIGNIPPVEYEQNYYAAQPAREDLISGEPSLH